MSDFYQHCKGEGAIVCYLHGFKNLLIHNLFSCLKCPKNIVKYCMWRKMQQMLSVLWKKKNSLLSFNQVIESVDIDQLERHFVHGS